LSENAHTEAMGGKEASERRVIEGRVDEGTGRREGVYETWSKTRNGGSEERGFYVQANPRVQISMQVHSAWTEPNAQRQKAKGGSRKKDGGREKEERSRKKEERSKTYKI
jgi:hypothetical protein